VATNKIMPSKDKEINHGRTKQAYFCGQSVTPQLLLSVFQKCCSYDTTVLILL